MTCARDSPIDGPTDAYGSRRLFLAEFLYSSEATHNVVMVDAQNYKACTVPSNAPTLTSGDDRVALDQAGRWLFICGVEDHCQSGMKLAVDVQ